MHPWTQIYEPVGGIFFSALIASIPLILLFYMLAIRRSTGHCAAIVSTSSAIVLAIVLWQMPVGLALNATAMGMCFGLFPIVWIIITAVWIYNMTVESGEFEKIKVSLATLTDDRRLQALFIAFAFGSFIEGTAGFGTPVAITAAMLVGLGFNPIYAAGICLIANTAPVAFGAIGTPIVIAGQVSGLEVINVSKMVGRQLPFVAVIVPLWICVTMCGLKRSLEVLPAILVAGLCFALTQFVTSNFHGPYLPDILSAIATILGLFLLLRVWKPKNIWTFADEQPRQSSAAMPQYTTGEILRAWSPYIILAVMVFVWGLQSFKSLMAGSILTFPWPGLHGAVMKTAPIVAADAVYPAMFKLDLVTAAGTATFTAGLITSVIMPQYNPLKAFHCLGRTIVQLRFPILTTAAILGLAYIMNYSGMSATIGLAFTHTGSLFPFFSPLLGWLGVFLTGSDASSNALFCSLQRTTAEAVGIDPLLTVAGNSSGGVVGKMISPQSIAVATAATGLIGSEGHLFRFTLKHSLIMIVMVGLLILAQAYLFNWMIPG